MPTNEPNPAPPPPSRIASEIAHGRFLAENDPELQWGWGTPAGKVRARRRAQRIVSGAHIGPGSRVLEIGCGSGLFTSMFAASGAEILAVDLSPELIRLAQMRDLPNARFILKNFEDCALDGPFDAVLGSSVLHHLDLARTWRKILQLLKPGGWMSFAEPNMANPQVWMERHFRSFFPQVSPDETAFYRCSLRRTLQRGGFCDVRVTPFDWLHPATPESLIPAVSAIGRFLEKAWPLREICGSLHIVARKPQ